MDEPLSVYQQQMLTYAEAGVWALVATGCMVLFVLGILAVKAVW